MNRYPRITGTYRISEDYETINDALELIEADVAAINTDTGALHIAVENAQTSADNAQSSANAAQSTANTGVTNAATAQSTANSALSNAATAQSTANNAVTNAATAQSTADTVTTNLANHSADDTRHLTTADRNKMSGIASGAEVNQNAFSKVNNISANQKTDTLTIKGGTGITISTDPSTKEMTITSTGESTPGAHASSHLTGGSDAIPVATTTTDGLMSKDDKKNLDDKLPKANPIYTGRLVGDSTTTGRYFEKYLGSVTTLANSAHQKAEIEFPNAQFNGFFDVIITGSWNAGNNAGNLTKRFAIYTNVGVLHTKESRYVEVMGGSGVFANLAISDINLVNGKFVIKIAFKSSQPGNEGLHVVIRGMCTQTLSISSFIEAATLKPFYADSEVLPAPIVAHNNQVAFNAPPGTPPVTNISTAEVPNWNSRLHHGWSRFNSLGEISVAVGTETAEIIANALPNNSVLTYDKNATHTSSFYPSTLFGTVEVRRVQLGRVDFSFYTMNGVYIGHHNPGNAPAWTGWSKMPLSDGTTQINLNAHLHNGWRRYSTYGELGLTATANMAAIIDKLVDKSEMLIEVSVSNQIALGLTTNDYGTLKIVKHNALRVYAMFYNFNGDTKRGTHTSGAWVGWELQVGVKRVPNPHYWTADKPASLEVGTIIYTAVT